MSQHDYIIANSSGAAVRADLNDVLNAIATNNSGVAEPTTTYAYQWWADTNAGELKIRNAANNGWVTVGDLATANLGLLSTSGGTVTGDITLNAQSDLRFADSDSSNWAALQAPATLASNITWTLPALDGANNAVLATDGSGVLSFGLIDNDNIATGAEIAVSKLADGAARQLLQTDAAGTGVEWTSNVSIPGTLNVASTITGASSVTCVNVVAATGTSSFGTTSTDVITSTSGGGVVLSVGGVDCAASGEVVLNVNRTTEDGTLVTLRQAGTLEGSITVSGSTVSYNGAHLGRWSQLSGGGPREEILRGTVLSNLDEMCEWGSEDNEQLNRMKVSDIEGDPNVAGVFQGWDDDDPDYTNDFLCAMTGDFIIRIGAGTSVSRGDLLMSAGDGTAMPQGDDIVRSKTVAKVTSDHVTCTYPDGSYCVPCVLMAC